MRINITEKIKINFTDIANSAVKSSLENNVKNEGDGMTNEEQLTIDNINHSEL